MHPVESQRSSVGDILWIFIALINAICILPRQRAAFAVRNKSCRMGSIIGV